MGVFKKTEKSLFQIKALLLQNENIRKLLYNMRPSALAESAPTIDQVKDLISLTPYLEDKDGVSTSYRNAFMAIYPTRFILDTVSDLTQIAITVFITKDYYELDNESIRVLSILDEVQNTLDGEKLEFAGRLEIQNGIIEIIDTNRFVGYVTGWEVIDGRDEDF